MSDEVKLDPEWEREKVARQEAAKRPPPKPPRLIIGAVIATVLIAVTAATIYLIARDSKAQDERSSPAMVRIEIRSLPAMDVQKDGHKLGKTPVSFVTPKSTTPIAIDTQWTEQRIYREGARMIPQQAHKDVIPDRDKTVDFTRKDAKPITE